MGREIWLLIGHGSRDREGNDEFVALVEALRKRNPDRIIDAAFVEQAEPGMKAVLESYGGASPKTVWILPLLLFGAGHSKKEIPEAINQAYGAAGRVLTLLSHDTVIASGSVCEVEEKKCMGCGACVAACTYGAIEFRETRQGKKAVVNPVLCKGDGLCNAKCPTLAIQLKHFTDEAVRAQIDAAVDV